MLDGPEHYARDRVAECRVIPCFPPPCLRQTSRLARDGALVVDGATPEQFGAHMRDEKAKWAKVVQVSGAGTAK